ncbi:MULTISPECIES: nitrogenase component 1 [Pelosinus]|uniref:Oxidoreductase/nitrogenase component 1 n=1 Tax=Pelosinus fermentans B4 TaxID=1149862 RepID=I9L5W5_9FIRM|nr:MULTISPECIES: nitrogenase component 1 [Pelosinus]EIW15616.1 oxidoreductase/nitrogenase component 1 [Pelosinus fermentans B4]EIW26694.1 oxidoreductase/nitrogenase component 1 [Pelosinus fermentans A11]OAM92361.1 oxidoreductase/nitrogenase component 1 [Pelosinus fermentans DSM 17108]SDQ42141.1 Nitrogenase component 1 type Oxidoreductase [Pelosinus fermentans]
MGLHRFKPLPSGRMGILWTLAAIRDAALVEFGCMGHMLYSGVTLKRAGVHNACKLYSTHIDETDIALGGTERLNHTIDNVVKRDHPCVIFLLPSSIPEVIGTDLPALCAELQPEYPGVRLLPFGYGGFNVTQHRGIQEALLLLAKTLPANLKRTQEPTFNIIGSCADLFRFQADAMELVRIMEGAFGIKPLCVMTSDTSVTEIENMGGAHINLVIRREGEPAAKHLQQRFGTPYLLGRPYGIDGTTRWLEQITQIAGLTPDAAFLKDQREISRQQLASVMPSLRHIIRAHPEEAVLSLGGHADVVRGVLSFGCGELSLARGTCWCDCPDMTTEDIPYFSEDQWTRAVQEHKKGYLMASGEALEWAGRNTKLQISNPDTKWRLHPYEPPFMGFRGAVHLVNLWINENVED